MGFSPTEKQRFLAQYGPWAVVTGASSGIGRALAEQLAAAGLHLVLVARSRETLESQAAGYRSRFGTEVRVLAADVSLAPEVERVLEAVRDLDTGLLVAAAGFGTSGPFADASLETECNMLEVNCMAVLRMTHCFSRAFIRRGKGGIILLSSIVAFQGVPQSAHYAATKAYIQSLAEGLAVELKPLGVDVLAVAPGPVSSGFAQRAGMQMGAALTPEAISQPVLRALGRTTTVRPGWLTKVLSAGLATVPRWGKVKIMAAVMGGMTRHQA